MPPHITRRGLLAATALCCAPAGAAAAETGSLRALLRRRHMVRKFRGDPVSDEVVKRLLDAATRAPSAGHTEPWAFVVVRDEAKRRALAQAALGQRFVAEAPVVIVACADPSRSRPRYGERGERYATIDAAFASMLLLLAVTEEGLGACFVGAFHDDQVSRLLALPSHVRPLAVIPVGVPDEKPRRLRRRPLGEVVRSESW